MFLLIASIAIFAWLHTRSSSSDYTAGKCSDYYGGLYDSIGPGSIEAIANDYSRAIVVATVEDSEALGASIHIEDSAPIIKVTKVMKSNGEIHNGDVIPICQGMGNIALPAGEHPTVLVFIEGKDSGTWVPSAGHFGIAPQGKDGRFTLDGISEGPKSVSVDELQKVILATPSRQ